MQWTLALWFRLCSDRKLVPDRTWRCQGPQSQSLWKSKKVQSQSENRKPGFHPNTGLVCVKYSGDLNTDNHLNTGNIWIPNFWKFRFQMVWYSKGQSMGYVLYTRPAIQILDQYLRNQDGVCCDPQWVLRSYIQLFATTSIRLILSWSWAVV